MSPERSQFDRIAELQAKEGVMGDAPRVRGCTADRHEGIVERLGKKGWHCHYCGRPLDG